jgi:hypothetical protein
MHVRYTLDSQTRPDDKGHDLIAGALLAAMARR